ncbi:acyltransferase family protein [Enterococcus faecium]|uniref:acyltransferase family protein n=1 Tax=Enterococcus faecium TaxID=1352 RepID=UPI0030ED16DD
MDKRISWIDFGKGITIFLVVFGHVSLGLLQASKFSETSNQILYFFVEVVYVIHIPVFFALSGYFFKGYQNLQDFRHNILKKLWSLGIPYLVFSILMFIMKKIGGRSVRESKTIFDLLNIWKEPIDHLWFLYTLFSIFLILGFLSIYIKNDIALFITLLVGFCLVNLFPVSIYFIQRFFIWAPAFYFGRILRNIKISNKLIGIMILSYVEYILFWWLTNFQQTINYSRPGLWGVIIPISIVPAFGIFQNKKQDAIYNYFVKMGKISLPIYLIHAPVASVTRIMLFKFGITNLAVHLFLGVIVAWFFSIILFKFTRRIKIVDFIFYPTKYVLK